MHWPAVPCDALIHPADMLDCSNTASQHSSVSQLLDALQLIKAAASSHHLCQADSKLTIVAEKVGMTAYPIL